MAGSTSEDYGAGGRSSSAEGMSSGQQCQSGDSIVEWRSCEQVENGIPSTSPPYWDTDDDDDCGAKPSELYGKFTWKIENFSQISKRELRSNAFEVGGYKWYILIYPQGCDVCNHLSLFLCVANHDKLLPGWSHFAQFTIAVVNKDPKKSKYSDTLHRFWKKEHDWGWKKFMELSKVLDGFIVDPDTLVIKAQVQVIREKAHRPFRCLDCQYRRELVRVYLANVEQICRRFVEERRGKLGKLIEDKVRWSSFRAFWLGIDQNTKRRMSRDKTDAILKVVVKHFFIEKEVTSTLVMDSLYSGLKALECENENKRGSAKLVEMEESPAPMVRVEKDMFVLADDVLRLLERAALEPLPHQPLTPKDDKGSQNRTKDGSGEEFNKDSIERDERRLTELGRRTVEIFVVAHIFSRIEVSYQEAVALKRQEELIREEEAAGQAENDLRTKRGAAEKEKRTKKKQAKQRRSGRKGKDRVREEKFSAMIEGKHQEDSPPDERILETSKQAQSVLEKIEIMEDVSDVSGTGDDVTETIQPDLDDRDTSPINWDTDTSEIHPAMEASSSEIPNGQNERKNQTLMDDSSSTCSTDSVPSVVMNGPSKGNSLPNNKSQTLPSRGRNRRSKDTRDRAHGGKSMPSDTFADTVRLHDVPSSCRATGPESEAVLRDVSGSCRPTGPESEADLRDVSGSCRATEPESEAVLSLKDQIQRLEQNLVEKEEEVVSLQKKLSIKDQVDVDRPSKARAAEKSCSSTSPGKKPPSILQQSKQSSENTTTTTTTTGEPVSTRESSSNSPIPTEKSVSLATRGPQIPSISKSEVPKQTTPSKSTTTHQVSAMSRPSSAPLIPGPRPTAPIVSTVQTAPLLSRSVSAAGRLGTEPSPSAQSYVPQSYRNAIMGKTNMGTSPVGLPTRPSVNSSSQAVSHSLSSSAFVSSNVLPPQTTARKDLGSVRPGFTFGSVTQETLYRRHQWVDDNSRQETSSSGRPYDSNLVNDFSRLGIHGESRAKFYSGDVPFNGISSRQVQGMTADEFPHLDIINDLLDDEQNLVGRAYNGHQHHALNRQYTFPGDMVTADMGSSNDCCHFDQSEQYYDERLQRFYGTSSGPFNVMGSAHSPQIERSPYTLQNQWPFTGADLPMQNLGNTDANLYSYQLPDYSNLTDGVNRYAMYAPTKRH